MKVLFSKFHCRINLVALLLDNSGSRNKTSYTEFRNLKILRFFPYKIQSLKVFYVYSNMWKVFTRPTFAPNFILSESEFDLKFGRTYQFLRISHLWLIRLASMLSRYQCCHRYKCFPSSFVRCLPDLSEIQLQLLWSFSFQITLAFNY
jgi:hypothetical protein